MDKIERIFLFEDYSETDVNGHLQIQMIDDIIADAKQQIQTIPDDLQDQARIEIKKLWMKRLSEWTV